MLNDFTWDMTGYIPKHQVNPHGDGIIPYAAERIFQLEPEPPAVGNLNEYILSALQEKNLIYFSFFLHHYEPQLNKRIKDFLGVDGGDLYDTDRFIDIKLSCREQMLQKLMDYDLAKGAEYATCIFPFIRDAMLRFRMGEEKWSVSSLTNYKMVRSMAWLYLFCLYAVPEDIGIVPAIVKGYILACDIERLLIADSTDNFQIFFRKGKIAVVFLGKFVDRILGIVVQPSH